MPRLEPHVLPIVIECSSDETESRLELALRKAVGRSAGGSGLVEECAAARESGGPKLVVILDQFEQCLQAHPDPAGKPLVGPWQRAQVSSVAAPPTWLQGRGLPSAPRAGLPMLQEALAPLVKET